MTKQCRARLCIPGLARNFRHSVALSLTVVLLRKVSIDVRGVCVCEGRGDGLGWIGEGTS